MSPTVDGLRLTADQLRTQARAVEEATGSLRDPAGPETWTGPAADRHRSGSAAARIRAGTVADRLRSAAAGLDSDADALFRASVADPDAPVREGVRS